jgi:hypothetical protein
MIKRMVNFLESLGNTAIIAITILGVIAIFFKALSPITTLVLLSTILAISYLMLIFYQIHQIEERLKGLEEKYKRAEELIDVKSEILSLKNRK